jgi:PAS domain S-box-containing protein
MVAERLHPHRPTDQLPRGRSSIPDDFLQALGIAVYTTDADGVITSYNQAAAELWGREPEIGRDMWCGTWRLFYADGRPMAHDACPMGIALKEDRPIRGTEAIAERPDGSRRWFVPYPTPLHDECGNLVGAVNVLVDITDRKQAEEASFYLNSIITSSDDAIVSKDLDGTVTSWNVGAQRLFGYTAEEMVGRSIRRIIPADRQNEEDQVLARVRSGARVDHFETMRVRKDGSLVPISLTVSPVKDRHGRIIGASKIARDITQRKEAERAIAEALAVKDEFIGLVSHELRTPLTTILGNAAILTRGENMPSEEQRREAMQDVHREALRLNAIIEDLLSLARLEGGKIECEPVAIARLLERAVREYGDRSGREIELRVDGDAPLVLGDENLIGHVIGNYLSNADKYSPRESPIEVMLDEADGQGRVRVLDRGIGIDPEEAEYLFESFYRSKNVGAVSGMGVGLSVCRRLVRAIGGQCWAVPRDGGGSEFGFSLPVDRPT